MRPQGNHQLQSRLLTDRRNLAVIRKIGTTLHEIVKYNKNGLKEESRDTVSATILGFPCQQSVIAGDIRLQVCHCVRRSIFRFIL